MIRIITLNLNGIRSACAQGLLSGSAAQKADVVCVQEIKAQDADLDDAMRAGGHEGALPLRREEGLQRGRRVRARSPSRSGSASASRVRRRGPLRRGRFRRLSVVSLYLPSGFQLAGAPGGQVPLPEAFCRTCRNWASGREVVVCGDWNIAHKEIDLKNWKLQPEELRLPARGARLADPKVFDEFGFVDVFVARRRHPSATRGGAIAARLGQERRLAAGLPDRHPGHRDKAKATDIYVEERFSDHAPLIVDYDVVRPLVVSCGTQQSESLVIVEPGGHVGRLPLSLSTCPPGSCQEHEIERWGGGAVHQRVGAAAAVGG
jgi:exodeoxyribonuclease-3